MSPDMVWLLAPVTALSGVLLGLLALTVTLIRRRRVPDEPADLTIGGSPYYACHSTVCAHLATPHDPTPVGGRACRNCGATRVES
jgi:hypothetical protein